MPTHAENGHPGLGSAAKEVAEHASALARLELELAQLELKRKAGELGAGAGLAVAAGLLALYAVGFLFATVAAGLAEAMPWWLALLIVGAVLGGIAALLAWLAVGRFRKGAPPVPEQAIREAKLTSEAIKH
jgi:protein-S-isoprenylcysteine O-methyltransferase Ste14